MTQNQLQYWANKETERANRAREQENYRSNVAKEVETHRSNVAKETEAHRTNVANERIKTTDVIWSNANNTADMVLGYVIPDANARQRSADNAVTNLVKLIDIFG